MSEKQDDLPGDLATLSTQLLGLVTVLAQAMVAAGAVDAIGLKNTLDSYFKMQLDVASTDAERGLIKEIRRVIMLAIDPRGDDE